MTEPVGDSPESSPADSSAIERENRVRIDSSPPVRVSPWSKRQLITRMLWQTVARVAWVFLPSSRSALIRLFGGSVGQRCRFGSGVQIMIPWNLRMGDDVTVGDRVLLYDLGVITIGDGVVLDFRSHICAGSHDITHPMFPQTRPPISIGEGSFIGLDAYIGPGVTLGRRCRVHPRSSVYRDWGDDTELRGNPAAPVESGTDG